MWPGNPSSQHRTGVRADRALTHARERVAALLGCSALDIVWTSGATEACNTVLHHAAATAAGATVWVSAIEHPAVLESATHLFRDRLKVIPVDRRGVVELAWIEERLKAERPALVAVMAANNETGVLQPWAEVRGRCSERRVAYFCDATQWCGRQPAAGLGSCDFVAGSGHKFGGPRGVGFLKCPAGLAVSPLLHGGPQQHGHRAGTENVAGALALAAAWEWCEGEMTRGRIGVQQALRDAFERELVDRIPGVRINGAEAGRLWNTVSVVMPETPDCRQRWVVKLDKASIAASTGSACASGAEKPSHVLSAMGLSAAEAGRALRFSAGWSTEAAAWDELLDALLRIYREMMTERP